jgi:hypothetical protein
MRSWSETNEIVFLCASRGGSNVGAGGLEPPTPPNHWSTPFSFGSHGRGIEEDEALLPYLEVEEDIKS